MEIATIASVGTAMAQKETAQAIGIAVLKKALDTQSSTAASLLEALPPANLPPHLGKNVNTIA